MALLTATTMQGRYFFLLVSLVALGLLYPILELLPEHRGPAIWNTAFWLVLFSALRAVGAHRRVFLIASALALVAVSAGLINAFASADDLRVVLTLYAAPTVAFLTLTTFTILADVLGGRRVTVDKIFGAICVYLLIGMMFAYAFLLLAGVHPTEPIQPAPQSPHTRLSDYLYFSYVTLTTLGYGDLVPGSAPARLLASLEAIVGQLYLTILVARLIGLHITQERPVED